MALTRPDDTISEAEQRVRIDLAALYRLTALRGWDDLIFTHITGRVPGPEHHFLINPLGLAFGEVTASSLVKVGLDGRIISPAGAAINDAGFTIHSAVHAARDDAKYVIHLHTLDGMAVASQRDGLLPIGQMALGVIPTLGYHDYEGIALDLDERERIVASLGSNMTMILRHHGTLALGHTAAQAWSNIYYLERACSVQVRALTAGRDAVISAPDAAIEKVAALTLKMGKSFSGTDLMWAAQLRDLERCAPGFDR